MLSGGDHTIYRPLASLALQDASSITATLKDLNVKEFGPRASDPKFCKVSISL